MLRTPALLAGLGLALLAACAPEPEQLAHSTDPRDALDPQGAPALRGLGHAETAQALGWASLEIDEHRAIGVQRLVGALRASLAARGIDAAPLSAIDDRFVAATPPLAAFEEPARTAASVGQQRHALEQGDDRLRPYYDCPILAPDEPDLVCAELVAPVLAALNAAIDAEHAELWDDAAEEPEPQVDDTDPPSDDAPKGAGEEDAETGEEELGAEDLSQLAAALAVEPDELASGDVDAALPFIRAWAHAAEGQGAQLAALYGAEALREAGVCDRRPNAKAVALALGKEQGVSLVLELQPQAVQQAQGCAVNTDLIAEQTRSQAKSRIAAYMKTHAVCVEADLSAANVQLQRAESWRREGILRGIDAQVALLKQSLRRERRDADCDGATAAPSAPAPEPTPQPQCDVGAACDLVSPDPATYALPTWQELLGHCVCCRRRRATGRLACRSAGPSPLFCGEGADGKPFCERRVVPPDGGAAAVLEGDGVETERPIAPHRALAGPITEEEIGEPLPLKKCHFKLTWSGTKPARDVTFVAFGDVHAVDPTPGCPRNGHAGEQQNEKLRGAINSIEADNHVWPGGRGFLREGKPYDHVRGAIIAGDLTQAGRTASFPGQPVCREYAAYRRTFGRCGDEGKLRFPVYEGYGNHDSPILPGKGDPNDHPVIDYLDQITAAHRPGRAEDSYDDPRPGTGHYAWRWDDIWFVHLNLKLGFRDEVIEKPAGTRIPAPHNARQFLIDFLKAQPKDPRRQLVIVTHYPPHMKRIKAKERKLFCKVINDARRGRGPFKRQGKKLSAANPVAAMIHGHTHHTPRHYTWQCPRPYRGITIPTFDLGTAFYNNKRSAGNLHFTVFHLGRTRLEAVGVSAPADAPKGPWQYTHRTRLSNLLPPR